MKKFIVEAAAKISLAFTVFATPVVMLAICDSIFFQAEEIASWAIQVTIVYIFMLAITAFFLELYMKQIQ